MEWQAFYRMEPWGTEPADKRAAIVASTIANIHRGRGKPAYKLDHFMPQYRARKQQSWQEQLNIARQWAAVKG